MSVLNMINGADHLQPILLFHVSDIQIVLNLHYTVRHVQTACQIRIRFFSDCQLISSVMYFMYPLGS